MLTVWRGKVTESTIYINGRQIGRTQAARERQAERELLDQSCQHPCWHRQGECDGGACGRCASR